MNKKDSLAIIGLLFTGPFMTFYGLQQIYEVDDHDFFEDLLEYIEGLDLDYEFVRDILTDDYDSDFYHTDMGSKYRPLPENYDKSKLYRSEHDGQIWLNDNERVRIGIWCEVDGFIAWLDEYKKTWIVDSREEVAARKQKEQPIIEEMHRKIMEQTWDFDDLEIKGDPTVVNSQPDLACMSKGLYDDIVCPWCGERHFQVGATMSTAMYIPQEYKDGKLVPNKAQNHSVTSCHCLHCCKDFTFDENHVCSKKDYPSETIIIDMK